MDGGELTEERRFFFFKKRKVEGNETEIVDFC